MLAARDQENLVFSHQAGAASKQLQAKTPGARYPKTPLKVPLNDENATRAMGKSVLGTKARHGNENTRTIGKGGRGLDQSALTTPLEPRTSRAPLGNKTTNAKARAGQVQGVKDIIREIEKSQPPPTISRRPRPKSPQTESSKLAIHTDKSDPDAEEDVEYAPPNPKEQPYQSDIFPDGVLTFEGLKLENRLKGYYNYYYDPVDENGVSRKEKQFAEEQRLALEEGERRIKQDLDEFDWTVGDVPETATYFQRKKAIAALPTGATSDMKPSRNVSRAPPTITSRNAASALGMRHKTSIASKAKPNATKPALKPSRALPFGLPLRKHTQPPAASRDPLAESSVAVSRSTLGYTKGRNASSLLNGRPAKTASATPTGLPQSSTTSSSGSDATITPARFAQNQGMKDTDELKRIEFLSIFKNDEDDDGNLGTAPKAVDDDADEDFKLTINFD